MTKISAERIDAGLRIGRYRAICFLSFLVAFSGQICAPALARDADAEGQLGFLVGEATYIARECGLKINQERLGYLEQEFRVDVRDIQPDGRFRAAFITQAEEAREFLQRRRGSIGKIAFCQYAWERFGPLGLKLVIKPR